MLPTITETEKTISYSCLFDKPLAEVKPELYEEIAKSPVDASRITSVFDRNDILKPGYLEVENGYAVMPDGSGDDRLVVRLAWIERPPIQNLVSD